MTGDDEKLPPEVLAFTFDELDRVMASPAGGQADALVIELGGRGHFGASDVVRASEALHSAIGKLTERQTLILTIGGYDQDPRELWQVPKVVQFVRRVLKHAGVTHWSHPAVAMLNEETLALLVQCGVFGSDHPWTIRPVADRSGATLARYKGGPR